MQKYIFSKYRIVFKTLPLSPLHADTVFGHLCWTIKFRNGEETLMRFLELMKGFQPPIFLSDLIPADFLPKPMFKRDEDKEYKKCRYLKTADIFNWSAVTISDNYGPEFKDVSITRSATDRMTGKSLEGALFSSSNRYCPDGYDLYMAYLDESERKRVVDLLNYLKEYSGYGADKSCGFGQVGDVKECPIDPNIRSKLCVTSDKHCLALSGVVPVNLNLAASKYKLRVKYGRMAEEYAHGNPFKKPIAYMDAGSIYLTKDASKPAGEMVTNVSIAHSEVVQYGYGLGLEL